MFACFNFEGWKRSECNVAWISKWGLMVPKKDPENRSLTKIGCMISYLHWFRNGPKRMPRKNLSDVPKIINKEKKNKKSVS